MSLEIVGGQPGANKRETVRQDQRSDYRFNGPEYDPAFDKDRLTKQIGRIYQCMIDGQWRTFKEIADLTRDPENSVSAQLRHLRKPKFGSYAVLRRSRGDRKNGLFEYCLQRKDREIDPQRELFAESILEDLVQGFFNQ